MARVVRPGGCVAAYVWDYAEKMELMRRFWDVAVRAIDVPTVFRDFDDYWDPFLGGQGPAPGYAMSLPEAGRSALRDRIRSTLPFAGDGSIPLIARAWAARGRAVGSAPSQGGPASA